MTDARPLEGQVALVTGASSGLGRHFAVVLARAGAKVAVCARRVERLETLVAEIHASGGEALAVALDVSDPEQVTAGVERCVRTVGLPSILVNNAGIPDARRAHRMPLDLVNAVLDTNVRGPWLMSTEVARKLIEAGVPGRIINISSMSAYHYAGEGAALYAVSKAAVSRMTEVLAVEWAEYQVNVNAIAPGAFESEMMDGMLERVGDFRDTLPRKRLGTPLQLDSTLLFLASPDSEAVTGTVIRVDDGQTHR
ncbi:SDR family NAD(P)-dependent oxidoreductase [Nocardioides sp.]|uniref:SDR family NAD(P)-dependent oxidoreductase n=1 Tax=Nocardioides sp. TaxID=35761 RepID=UPI003D0A9DC0